MSVQFEKDFLDSLVNTEELYQNAPCGYFSFVPDGTIIKINKTLLNWLGYEPDAVVGQMKFTDLISKGGKIYYEMFYFPLLQLQNAVKEINFDYIRADRSSFPALINSNVITDDSGSILAVNATVYDITDRKKYENSLLEAKKTSDAERSHFELLSDFIPEMIWTADQSGFVNYANKRFLNYFDISADEVNSKTILSKIHSNDRFKCLAAWKKTLESGKDFEVQIRLISGKNFFHWFLVRAIPFKDQTGQIIKWMGSCTNVDDHVNAIQKLDEFISIASHELKTPITSLKASLQLMDRVKDTDSASRMLPRLIDQSNRNMEKIHSLVNDLLNTSSIKEGQIQLNSAEFNVFQLLSNSCTHVRLEEEFQLIVSCDENLMAYGDEHRVDQVVVNFVNNAIKYAPQSKIIYLIAEQEDKQVKISVKDGGEGISKDKIPYLFDRYYRIDHSGNQYSGLGLGLYICAEIVKRHGGQIGADSDLGQGATFWFTLPALH